MCPRLNVQLRLQREIESERERESTYFFLFENKGRFTFIDNIRQKKNVTLVFSHYTYISFP